MVLGLSTLMAVFAACDQGPRDLRAIQHVVFIVKENRTFDHYFGTFPGADGATTGIVSNGQVVPLTHLGNPSQLNNLCNSWDCAIEAVDDGKMDKRTVFADGLVQARAVKVLDHGVLVLEPPNIWLMHDTNGDLKMDTKELVSTGYGRREGGVEGNANGFFWGIDNWIHSAGSSATSIPATFPCLTVAVN